MSFLGYLVKIGTDIIPDEFIRYDTYKVTPDQRQDVDSYRDLNQDLHRNVSDNFKSIVQFSTRAGMTETKLRELIDLIQNNFTVEKERKVHITYWNTDKGDYSVGEFYMVQPNYTITRIEGNQLFYNAMDIKFIEY